MGCLWRNYRLIVATWKFDVLKTNIYHVSLNNIKLLRDSYQTDCPAHISFHWPVIFNFLDESRKVKCKI